MSSSPDLAALPRLILARGHVQPIWAGHPWVFAQAVARWEGSAEPGAEVLVCDARGQPIGRALHSPGSAIVARLFTRDAARPIDAALFDERLRLASERRQRLGLPNVETTGLRLVHAEGDELCVQWGSIGLWRRQAEILELLERRFAPRAIVDRSSARTARQEGFTPRSGVLRGASDLRELEFLERGLRFRIP